MNDNDELLLLDSPPSSPKSPRLPTEEDDLLLQQINQETSTARKTFYFPQKMTEEAQQTGPSSRFWSKETTFFLQEESSDSDQELSDLLGRNKKASKYQQEIYPNFRYNQLIAKLELAYRIIQQAQKDKTITLFTSVKHLKSASQCQNIGEKALKTQRTRKAEATDLLKRKSNWKKYTEMRKSATEPDENTAFSGRPRPKALKTSTIISNRVINEVDEKQSPLKGRKEVEKQRTKEEFLASMTNWQQRRKLKQLQMIQKEKSQLMNGVTFTPAINQKSKLLMKKKGNLLPIYERQPKQKKIGDVVTPKPIKGKK